MPHNPQERSPPRAGKAGTYLHIYRTRSALEKYSNALRDRAGARTSLGRATDAPRQTDFPTPGSCARKQAVDLPTGMPAPVTGPQRTSQTPAPTRFDSKAPIHDPIFSRKVYSVLAQHAQRAQGTRAHTHPQPSAPVLQCNLSSRTSNQRARHVLSCRPYIAQPVKVLPRTPSDARTLST